ncbi:MAG: glutathione S-transferase [Deltaproteobacteria bacterium RIFCSPLOWO2_02_FULL_53_8]|nr:MAG: glutathione S-transferase [Deltaproteobacteria bacterium RIFCSPLOWO2_02_FULL_53_8]
MKLYYAPGTCALACWISLEWSGLECAVERVAPQSSAYRSINPLGMVPALDIGGPRPMTQADAILQYIAERSPERDLGSDQGIEARFEFNECMSFLTGDFHPAFWPYFAPERFTANSDAASLGAVREAAVLRVERVLTHLDALIGTKGHVYRGKRTVADPYAFVMSRWSEYFPRSWKDFPNLARFMESMLQDPAVAAVIQRSNVENMRDQV